MVGPACRPGAVAAGGPRWRLMKLRSRICWRRAALRALLGTAGLGATWAFTPAPAAAQWGDAYEQPRSDPYAVPPRRRARDNYYRDDNAYGARQARRYAPQPQEAPRQFYWPWEDRPQQAQPQPQPEPSYRPARPRAPAAAADAQRVQKRRV